MREIWIQTRPHHKGGFRARITKGPMAVHGAESESLPTDDAAYQVTVESCLAIRQEDDLTFIHVGRNVDTTRDA